MRVPMAIFVSRAAIPLVVVYSSRFPSKALPREKLDIAFVDAQEFSGLFLGTFSIKNTMLRGASYSLQSKVSCRLDKGAFVDSELHEMILTASHEPLDRITVEALYDSLSIERSDDLTYVCRYDFYVHGSRVRSFCLDNDDRFSTKSFRLAELQRCL